LLEQFIDRARSDGATRVHLEVRDGNPAIAMYRAAGFEPVGRRRKYYHAADGRNFDALTFARAI
jgi:ribosomal-protein-alanine N-acetyltransferase